MQSTIIILGIPNDQPLISLWINIARESVIYYTQRHKDCWHTTELLQRCWKNNFKCLGKKVIKVTLSASIPAWITGPRTVSVSLVSPNIVGICSKRLKNNIDLKCNTLHHCTVPENNEHNKLCSTAKNENTYGIALFSLIKTLRKTDLKYQDIPIYYTSGFLRTY